MKSVSVIIPIYNVEKYLGACLESVVLQSFDDYEVICVNDASTDNSIEILKRYMESYDRIRLVEHEENRGLSAARNTGLREAKGKYIFFLDSDDMIVNNALEELFVCAEKNRTDIVYFNMSTVWEEETKKPVVYREPQYKEYNGVYTGTEMFELFTEDRTYKIEAWRQFYRKEFLIENNLWFYEGILHEDNLFSFLCAMKACRVMNINKNYYVHRIHENSIMTTKNRLRAESLFVVLMEIFHYWNGNKFNERLNRAIEIYFSYIYDGFLACSMWGSNDAGISVGSAAERCFYYLMQKSKKQYVTLSNDKLKNVKESKYVIVYGAGKAAEDVVHILHDNNIHVYGIAVSTIVGNPQVFCGIEVNEITHYCDISSDSVVVVGITGKYRGGIVERLKDLGFADIIVAEDVQ